MEVKITFDNSLININKQDNLVAAFEDTQPANMHLFIAIDNNVLIVLA